MMNESKPEDLGGGRARKASRNSGSGGSAACARRRGSSASSVLASPSTPRQQQCIPSPPTADAAVFCSDEFRMMHYKVLSCSTRAPHDW